MPSTGTADVLIRRAGDEDVPHLVSLRARWRNRDPTPEFSAQLTQWFREEEKSRWWWLALDESEAVAMVNLKLFERMPSPDRPPSRWGYLANLYVLPEHRQRGIGSRLVEALLQSARDAGMVRVVLSPSEPSTPLYERHGFSRAHGLLVNPLSPR